MIGNGVMIGNVVQTGNGVMIGKGVKIGNGEKISNGRFPFPRLTRKCRLIIARISTPSTTSV